MIFKKLEFDLQLKRRREENKWKISFLFLLMNNLLIFIF